MLPIWKDYDIQLASNVTSIAYRVKYGADVIYEGRAFAHPGATVVKARLNNIVASQLVRGFTPAGETDVPFIVLTVEVYSSGSWSQVGNALYFYADWSYDYDFDGEHDPLNAPISDILLPGQLVPSARVADTESASDVTFRVTYETPTGDFNPDFNRDFLVVGSAYVDKDISVGPAGTAWLDLMDYPTATKVEVQGKTYRVGGGSCNKHAFYYVNAYGAWDTLVVQGNTKIVDGLTHHNTDKVYNNGTTPARGTVNYLNELARKYTFNTAYMSSEDSQKMHHLLNSPHVLVHDTVTGHIWPLVLTGTATEHKHGARLYSYAIEAALAQQRVRR